MDKSIAHIATINGEQHVITVFESGEIRYVGPTTDIDRAFVAVPQTHGRLDAFDSMRRFHPFDGIQLFIDEVITIAREEFGVEWGLV